MFSISVRRPVIVHAPRLPTYNSDMKLIYKRTDSSLDLGVWREISGPRSCDFSSLVLFQKISTRASRQRQCSPFGSCVNSTPADCRYCTLVPQLIQPLSQAFGPVRKARQQLPCPQPPCRSHRNTIDEQVLVQTVRWSKRRSRIQSHGRWVVFTGWFLCAGHRPVWRKIRP